jgi:nitronate monooxygenase
MPYKLSEIAALNVNYLPIISSSARAFRALWKRAYSARCPNCWARWSMKTRGWRAATTACPTPKTRSSPKIPIPASRPCATRCAPKGIADDVPIVMAGGVWFLREWDNWIDNPELGQIAFQFGTRPLLTHESPIPQGWKDALRELEPGDVLLHRFRPRASIPARCATPFLRSLEARSERQIPYSQGGRRASIPSGSMSG